MRNRIIRWTERFFAWRMKGRFVVLMFRGQPAWVGTIMGVQIDEGAGEVVLTAFHKTDGVVPLDTDCHHAPVVRFPLTDGLAWNSRKHYYEVDANVLVPGTRRHPPGALGGGAYGPGDSQAPREEPEHDQGPPQAFGPSAPSHRGAFGEGEGGFPPGYHVPYAGEGPEDGADDPGEDSDVGGEGPERTLTIALAVYEDSRRLPDGILVAVSPDQEIAIYRLDEPPPTMTDGTIIYANQFTAEQYAAWSRRMYGDPSNH
jgi:hypothetical protein